MKTPLRARLPCRAPTNFWISDSDGGVPLLGLEVDDIEAEAVLADDAVDAFVAALPTACRHRRGSRRSPS